jgi:hypothetical protein
MAPLIPTGPWPNSFDVVVTTVFLVVVILLPAAGYVFMALDIRAYLRSLRRGLSLIGSYLAFPEIPEWARDQTPRAIAGLGLRMPCTEAELMQAYRQRVMQLHPDLGGDERRFLILQANFEEALSLVRAA